MGSFNQLPPVPVLMTIFESNEAAADISKRTTVIAFRYLSAPRYFHQLMQAGLRLPSQFR